MKVHVFDGYENVIIELYCEKDQELKKIVKALKETPEFNGIGYGFIKVKVNQVEIVARNDVIEPLVWFARNNDCMCVIFTNQ